MAPMTAALHIGWIGTGVMGGPMAGHLLDRGHDVSVFNRTRSRTDALVEAGAQWRDSPAELAQGVDVVVTMLGTPADVRDTVLGEGRVLECMREGALLIDMTTSEPSLAVEIHEAARAAGVDALDAPVSGGDVGARNGTLVIMVGGERQAFDRARPVFEPLGKTIELQGGAGAGQHTKMVNQLAIAAGMIGVCEALVYGQRAGLNLDKTLATIQNGAAGSWSLSNYGPRLLRGDLEPGFKVDHFIKDLGIALAEARAMNVVLPGAVAGRAALRGRSQPGPGAEGHPVTRRRPRPARPGRLPAAVDARQLAAGWIRPAPSTGTRPGAPQFGHEVSTVQDAIALQCAPQPRHSQRTGRRTTCSDPASMIGAGSLYRWTAAREIVCRAATRIAPVSDRRSAGLSHGPLTRRLI